MSMTTPQMLDYFKYKDSEKQSMWDSINGVYTGNDLASVHSGEIANHDSVWSWISERAISGDFNGINIGDFITFNIGTDIYHATVMGLNTYKNTNDVGNHIDFICRELWRNTRQLNKAEINNGTALSTCPWTASDLYLYVNSLAGPVIVSETFTDPLESVDYTNDGILHNMPTELQDIIIPKIAEGAVRHIDNRWTDVDSGSQPTNLGKLWLPSVFEISGCSPYEIALSTERATTMYPLFNNTTNRIKTRPNRTNIEYWWTRDAVNNGHTRFVGIGQNGWFGTYNPKAALGVPICFRIGEPPVEALSE